MNVDSFADLSIVLAVSGVIFLFLPRILDIVDREYLTNKNGTNEKKIIIMSIKLILPIFVFGAILIYLISTKFYFINDKALVIAGMGSLLFQVLVSTATPYFKGNNQFHILQWLLFISTLIGFVFGSIFLFLVKSIYAITIIYSLPACLFFVLYLIVVNNRLSLIGSHFNSSITRLIFNNLNILKHGFFNSIIKSTNDYGIILIIGALGTKGDVALLSLVRSFLLPIRNLQTYFQANIFKELMGEVSFRKLKKIRVKLFSISAIIFLILTFISWLLYLAIDYINITKYSNLYIPFFIIGCASCVTFSALWTYPIALKMDLLFNRSKSAFGRLLVSIPIVLIKPDYVGASIAILSATIFSRVYFDRRLINKNTRTMS